MIIKECIFNGVIVSCKCGVTEHVAFSDLHTHACACGRTLSKPDKRLKRKDRERKLGPVPA